ncbi:hypothetical protein FRB90_011892 [Tulasnella sp. 427]|nr:hypothetical protein FRB90_011892 [Tulasnella sp. 427]
MLGQSGHPNIHQMQQQNQQNQQSQQSGQQQNPPQGPPPNGQDYNLSNVLHFLQTEWRHYERDRNEWEIERAEMRARIALLEGERRSFENVKLDLMRRIKMLEYALRMERSKQLNQPSSAIPPQKAASLQGQSVKEEGSHKDGSGNSSPRSDDSPLPGTGENRLSIGSLSGLPNGTGPSMTSSASASGPLSAIAAGVNMNTRPQTWAGVPNGAALPSAIGKPPPGRDAKGRARSRDFLKQCLQEVNYLTSSAALNPLPNRPILTAAIAAQASQQPLQHAQALLAAQQQGSTLAAGTGMPLSLPNLPSFDQQQHQQAGFGTAANGASGLNNTLSGFNGRPRKMVPEVGKDFPTLNGLGSTTSQQGANANQGAHIVSEPPNVPPPNPGLLGVERDKDRAGTGAASPNSAAHPLTTEGGLSLERQIGKQSDEQGSNSTGENEANQITAIFRPDAAGEWKERLRAASEAVERAKAEEELAALSTTMKDEDDDSVSDDGDTIVGDDKLWKPRRTLRNHLDAVRALAFHPSEMCLATGGDDFTIKIWRMDANDLLSNSSQGTEIEPQLTLRGHSSSITRLVISAARNLLYSASLDSTIRVWSIPSQGQATYAPYDATRAKGVLVGHTDAVWDLALLRDDTLLVSGGSDGAIKVWDISLPGNPLKLSWGFNGVDGEAESSLAITSLDGIKTDLKKVAVAFSNAIVKLFDVETGAEVGQMQSDATYDGTPATQINKVVSHPTMSILVTAHEDKYIRLFDLVTGACTYSMLAHTEGVTSLSIDGAGFSLVSGGHDCSIRFWDVMGNKVCLQEITNHRKKADEGVLDVEYCPSLPILASAGADGIVKLYASS